MSLDYNVCDNCGEVTVNYEIRCDCNRHWCGYECADEDGFIPIHCDKYEIYGEEQLEMGRKAHKCEYTDCIDCNHCISNSCAYCRDEKFEDSELLKYALGLLRMTKEELILVIKNTKKTIKEYK